MGKDGLVSLTTQAVVNVKAFGWRLPFHVFPMQLLWLVGVAMAAFWVRNPWLIPFSVAPLLLIHRSLSVPRLEAEARVDPKTGLFNARHFAAALREELGVHADGVKRADEVIE